MEKAIILNVWNKGNIISGNDPYLWRQDDCGAWIGFQFYGNRDSEYGWEIDHITSKANGGNDNLSNLRPLQWENNMSKSDGRLSCKVISNGIKNILKYNNNNYV